MDEVRRQREGGRGQAKVESKGLMDGRRDRLKKGQREGRKK